jgi:hypothetical protein
MKPRVLGILAAVTAGVLVVGVLATRSGNGTPGNSSAPSGRGEPSRASGTNAAPVASGEYLFPALRANADAIVELHISQGDKAARIVRAPGANEWQVATLGNYPANADRVRDTVRSMVDAKVIERKTARKESHAAIGLEDPAAAGARSIRVDAVDTQGNALARLVLGDIAPTATPNLDPNTSARFVRRVDEDQSYLVAGRFPADPSSTAWVVRSILEIPGTRVREVRITPAVGEGLVASREAAAGELAIQDIPTGRTVKDQTQVARLAQALAFLTLEDVKPASEGANLDNATTFDAITFDHLLIRVRVSKVGDDYWARIEALPEPMPTPSTTQATSDGVASAPAANTEVSIDDPSPDTTPPETADTTSDPSRDAARAEAEQLNAKLAPWIFKLNATKGAQLTSTLDDFLTPSPIQGPELPIAPPAPEPATEPAPLPAIVPPNTNPSTNPGTSPDTQPGTDPGIDPAKKLFPDSRP